MKKVNALVLGLAALLAFGCGGDEKKDDPEPEENYTSCRIKKMRVNNDEYIYIHDSAGKLIQVNRFGDEIEIFEYNALGKVSRSLVLRSGDTIAINTFEYNSDSLRTSVFSKTRNHSNEPYKTSSIQTFEYDLQNRIIRMAYRNLFLPFPMVDTGRYDYIYNSNNKVHLNNFVFDPSTNSWELKIKAEVTFDNKKIPYEGKGDAHGIFGKITGHNVLLLNRTYYDGGVVTHTNSSTTNHTYNSAGYPVESIQTSSGIVTVYKYEYNCQ